MERRHREHTEDALWEHAALFKHGAVEAVERRVHQLHQQPHVALAEQRAVEAHDARAVLRRDLHRHVVFHQRCLELREVVIIARVERRANLLDGEHPFASYVLHLLHSAILAAP